MKAHSITTSCLSESTVSHLKMQSTYLNNTSPSNDQFSLSICKSLGELKNPQLITPASLNASLAALITTGIACPLAVVLNSLVLLAFYKKPSLRTQSNTMIGVMAANDLVKGGIGCAFFMAKEINYQMEYHPKCAVLVGLFLSTTIVSDVIVTGMNLEKFLALRFPYWHRVHVTTRRILTTTLVSILTVFLASVIRVIVDAGRFLVVVPFVICTISTVIFAVSIWKVISKRNRQIHVQSEQAGVSPLTSSEKKAAKMATYIAVGVLFTSLIPLFLLSMIIQNSDSKKIAEPLLQAFFLCSCLINPLIYGFMNQDIRKACKEIIKCQSSNATTIQVQP